jgi:NADPH:quinone reductase-like Zn-dependent oxidoreductase
VQLAKALGLRVIGTASTEHGLQAVRDQGADLAVNHKQEGYLREIAVGNLLPAIEMMDLRTLLECGEQWRRC